MASLVVQGEFELQRLIKDMMSTGKKGQSAVRKGLRAAAKVVAAQVKASYPKKTGAAVKSVKVRAMKRKKGRIGVRVALFAESRTGKGGFPYPMALESGAKKQPASGRVRKAVKKVSVNGRSLRVTDEANSKAYHALTWHIRPRHDVQKAFDAAEARAQEAAFETITAELKKASMTP